MKYEITRRAKLEEIISNAHEFAICIESQAEAIWSKAFELRLCGLLCDGNKPTDRKAQQKAAYDWMIQHYDAVSSCIYTALVLSGHIQELLEYVGGAVCEEV